MYYRRWTRMHLKPGMKYFMKYGVLNPMYDKFAYLMQQQNPEPLQYKTRRIKVNKDKTLDTKLIDNLFLKYPDLKFEPISHTKYPGTKLNTFSYAYAFINEQKKLIKQGYTISKAFQITQQKYHEKMKRKLDQSLLSRGLAIGNRARSFLNIYQQQSEYQARLKTQRSQRQLQKYELKLKAIKQTVQQSAQDVQSPYLSDQVLNYNRLFYDIKQNPNNIDYNGPVTELGHEQIPKNDGAQRTQFVNRLQSRFKHLFNKFYEHAATKDRLQGLTDGQIIKQIQSSPMKLKRQMKQLIRYFQNRNIDVSVVNGKIVVSGPNSEAISDLIKNNNYFKIGFLSQTLNYQKPVYSTAQNPLKNRDSISEILKKKNIVKQKRADPLTDQQKDLIKQNKRKQLELVSDNELFYHKQAYKIFQTQQERLLRLEIKYYDKLVSQIQHHKDKIQLTQQEQLQKNQQSKEVQQMREQAINNFRRLKLRLQSRYKNISAEEFLFGQHQVLKNELRYEEELQYQQLIGYLRKKSESRRLTSLDQSNDAKINKFIRIRKIGQAAVPQGQGQTKVQ